MPRPWPQSSGCPTSLVPPPQPRRLPRPTASPPFEQQVDGGGALVFDGAGDPVYDLTKPYATITVEPVSTQSVRVRIDAEGDVYFGSVVLEDSIDIERRATAEYVLAIPMGNPSSAIGTGNLANPAGVQNMWLAVNSYCTGRTQGDQFSAFHLTSSYVCPGTWTRRVNGFVGAAFTQAGRANNPQYDPKGYYLVADMPSGSEAYNWRVEVYQPGICDYRNEANTNQWLAGDPATRLRGPAIDATLYAADATPLSDADNLVPANVVVNRTFPLTDCGWSSLGTIPSTGLRGRRLINFRSLAMTNETGINYFAVRLVPAAGPTAGQACGSAMNNWCPQLSSKDYLPVYAPSVIQNLAGQNTTVLPNNAIVNFYLSEIDAVHAGKTLVLELFDPGEGMNNLQVVGPPPTYTRYPFTFATTDCSAGSMCNDGGPIADFTGDSNPQCATPQELPPVGVTPVGGTFPCLRVTNTRFNNRTAKILIDIPTTYTCTTDCWWRLRYQPSANVSVTDRTTWSASIIGDPVRLVE